MAEKRDLVIVGGGPGGYLAAMRAAQLKKTVTLVDQDRIGGTCINYGCIPTKYLLHQTKILKEVTGTKTFEGPVGEIRLNWAKVQQGRQAVVDQLVKGLVFLLEKGKVEIVKAPARIRADRTVVVRTPEGERVIEGDKVIVATGSQAAGLPFLKVDGQTVITSTEALTLAEVPKSLLVIGAGAIGLEMGSIYRRLGDGRHRARDPAPDPARIRQGSGDQAREGSPEAGPEDLHGDADRRGRRRRRRRYAQGPLPQGPHTLRAQGGEGPPLGRPEAEHGGPLRRRRLSSKWTGASSRSTPRSRRAPPGFYAIGDVIGGKLLAHKAYHDALVAADNACGLKRTVEYGAVPAAVFTEPEFATVGLSQEEAAARGIKVKSGVFPLQASGRAMTMDATDGLVKVLADEADKVIGAHVVAPGASDMLPVLTMAVAKGLTLKELDSIIYIHPTLSETIGEAALKANNEALHILNS